MKLAALVLAAGSARRFGSDKLSASFDGEPLLHHAVRAARAAPVQDVTIITNDLRDPGEWPGEPPVATIRIASTALSDSLKAGIVALEDVDGVYIFLGDMPLIPHDVADRLADALGDSFAAVPRHTGKNGHPVLLSARAFAEVSRLSGDEGAGRLLKQRDDVTFVDIADDAILLDVDRAEDLTRLQSRQSR